MPKLEFNPEFGPSAITHIIHENVRLREDIRPISGQILDMAEIDSELNDEFEELREEIVDGVNNADLDKGDLKALREKGFKNDGENSYLISPIGEGNWYSDHLFDCTTVVAIGRKKGAETKTEISFMTHQDPSYFIDGGGEKTDKFSQELSASLKELKEQSQEGTIEVVFLGGNFNPAAKGKDYIHRHYRQSIEKLRKIVQETLGFDPKVLAGPNNNIGSETVVGVETQKRKIWIERNKQPPVFNESFQAENLDEQERKWLKAA